MSLPSQDVSQTQFSIHPATRIGHVSLSVADLERELAFYQEILGLTLNWRENGRAGLGGGPSTELRTGPSTELRTEAEDLLRLVETPGYRRYGGTTGLYHFAVLLPDRHALAVAVGRLFSLRYRNHPTDHILTKTTYLDDPEGNGIELYTESPEDGGWSMANGQYVTRRADGSLSDGREPLDLDALFSHLSEGESLEAPMPPETRIGHVHLYVADLDTAVDFYHGVLGFDVMGLVRDFRMAFVSAGGYHHHIGLNTWRGEGSPPAPPDALGLRHFSVELPDQAALDQVAGRIAQAGIPANETADGLLVHDPFENGVMLGVRT
jgi:catechol 2,3-dioxygenase